MRLSQFAGYSFPSTGGRLLLDPDPAGNAGGVTVDAPTIPGGTIPDDSGAGQSPAGRDFLTEGTSPDSSPDTAGNSGSNLVPADPNQAAASEWQSIRDASVALGYQFPATVQDDRQALAHLVDQVRQQNYYAQVGQRLAPHSAKIQEYLRQQQAPQQAAAPPARPAWEAPPFDRKWAGLVEQDPATGFFLGKPGTPQSIVDAVNEYADWKQKYDENPAAMIQEMFDARFESQFEQRYAERTAVQQRQSSIASIVRENGSWFYAQDAAGRMIPDQCGRPQPSPVGAAYIRHLGTVRDSGVTDPSAQDRLAKQLLQGELALSHYQKSQQGAQAAAPPARQAAFNPNVNQLGAGLTPSQQSFTPGATEQATDGLSLSEIMRRAFAQEGVTDEVFRNL